MDVFSDVLRSVKLSSAVYFRSDFSSPWGMDIPRGPFAQFHMITRGQCLLSTGDSLIQLFAGDIVVFPLGTSHWLADETCSKRENGQEVVRSIMKGDSLFDGETVSTTIVCGHFEFDRSIDHPFLSALPEVIYIKDEEQKELPWLQSIANLVIHEAGNNHLGSEVIVDRLGETLFVYILRAFMQKNSDSKGFMAAMSDERINKVLKAIHDAPEIDWQLIALAQIAGMSRTGFSNRFKELLGETPLTYITNWRLLKAKELLKESKKTVGEIASEVGYQSEAAFNRVFKKNTAKTPLKYRQSLVLS